MSTNTCKITVETTGAPPARACWEVDLPDDPVQALTYNNLAYDLVGLVTMKLGVEYSKFLTSGDSAALDKFIAEITVVSKVEAVAS